MSQNWVNSPTRPFDEDEWYISASKIKKYAKCPKSYYYNYRTEREESKASKGYRGFGSAIHESIENVLLSDPIYDQHVLARELKEEYRRHEEAVMDDMFDGGLEQMDVVARFLAANVDDVVGVEEDIYFALSEPIDAKFRGILDVVTASGDIIDWKTGRFYEEDDGDRYEENTKETMIQGALYMRAYLEKYGEPPNLIRFVYPKAAKERTYQPNDEVWEVMIEHAKILQEGVENYDWEAKPGGQCFFCGYEFFCPDSDYGYGSLDYNKI